MSWFVTGLLDQLAHGKYWSIPWFEFYTRLRVKTIPIESVMLKWLTRHTNLAPNLTIETAVMPRLVSLLLVKRYRQSTGPLTPKPNNFPSVICLALIWAQAIGGRYHLPLGTYWMPGRSFELAEASKIWLPTLLVDIYDILALGVFHWARQSR